MKRCLIRTIVGAGVVIFAFGARILVAGPPPKDTSVLLTFGHTSADRLTSDGATVTVTGRVADYANGLQNVLSVVQGSGNFRFYTQIDARFAVQRRMCLDFGTQFLDQGLAVPFADGQARQCINVAQPMHSFPTGDVPIYNLRYGQSVRKLTRFEWDDGGYRYRVGYGTDIDMDGNLDSPAVRVTCIAPVDATQPCAQWVLAPETDGTAALFRFALLTKRGNVSEGLPEFFATVVMPFTQTLTIQ